jgi:hypothetical protein
VTNPKDGNSPSQPPVPLIRSADFRPIRVELEVRNTTTGAETRKDFAIRLIEVGEKSIVLELPRKSCAMGHGMSIEVDVYEPNLHLSTTARVVAVETFDSGGDGVTLNLMQYDDKTWQEFLKIFSARQREIEAFFSAVKGF